MHNAFSDTKFSYWNPVKIRFGCGLFNQLSEFVGNRKVMLITTTGCLNRDILKRLQSQNINVLHIISDIQPNPTITQMEAQYHQIHQRYFDVILAIGGGSVMDSAKVFSVVSRQNPGKFEALAQHILGQVPLSDYERWPVICVPTTSGTSSEITPWSTVWDKDNHRKHSLHLLDLWPELSLYDPELTLSLPYQLTLQTGLDALSHCLESLWNVNANPVSTRFAIQGARHVLHALPLALADLTNIDHRSELMLATVNAGMAFSNTQTAIAHAISYYLTARYDIAHGIACSFSLPHIVAAVAGIQPEVDAALADIFGDYPAETLRRFFESVKVSTALADYMPRSDFNTLNETVFQNNRIKNSVVPILPLMKLLMA